MQAELAALLPPRNLEGTLEVKFSGAVTRGALKFQAPDNLRIDVAPDETARIEARTTFARAEETRVFFPATKRVRARSFHPSLRPWRSTFLSDGGPANLVLFGWPQAAASEYSLALSDAKSAKTSDGKALPAGARLIAMTAKKEIGSHLQTDFSRSGGDNLLGLYAAYQQQVFDRPARISLALSQSGAPLFREDSDSAGKLLTRTEFKSDAKTRLPLSAVTRDAKNRVVEVWSYDLKTRDSAFDAATFALPEIAREQILEDASTRAVSAFAQAAKDDADAAYNRGNALWERVEDVPAALAAWGEAARIKPRATAPHFTIFRAALATKNLALANRALEKLAALLGENDVAVTSRRVQLSLARRDFEGAQKALDAAEKAAPQNLRLLLSRAEVLQGLGDAARAREVLSKIVGSPNAQDETQVAAAQSLASLLAFDAQTKDESSLAKPEKNTVWTHLARAHFALLRDKNARIESTPLESEPLALASLAFGLENQGRTEDAIATWEKLQNIAFFVPGAGNANAPNIVAREHLLALHAARGQSAPSVGAARDLMSDYSEEGARRRVPEALWTAWRKAGKLSELGAALKQRSQGSASSEDDLRLWLAYQENAGTSEAILLAIRSGAKRFPKSAWWSSRLAEFLSDRAASLSVGKFEEARKLFDEALAASTRAARLDATQPYYASQNALIQTQKVLAMRKAPVIEPGAAQAGRDAAVRLYDALAKTFPNNADIELTIATARNALTVRGDASANAAVFAALQNSGEAADGAGRDRHAVIFFARQAAAMMMRQQGDFRGAAAQYDLLLLAPRDANEQARIAISYAQMLLKNDDAATSVARVLAQLAAQAWPLESAQDAGQFLARALVAGGLNTSKIDDSPILAVAEKLRAAQDAPSILASANLHFALLNAARELNARENAPESAERFLRDSEKRATDAEAALRPMATNTGDDASGTSRVLAARALVLLGERAGARGQWKEVIAHLSSAMKFEPESIELRVALARALGSDGNLAEARRVRDETLRAFPSAPRLWQRASVMSAFSGDFDSAISFAQSAIDSGQAARGVSPQTQAQSHLALANASFDAGGDGAARSSQTWKFLSGESWPFAVRLAALLDAQSHLMRAQRTGEAEEARAQIAALSPSDFDYDAAADIINGSR